MATTKTIGVATRATTMITTAMMEPAVPVAAAPTAMTTTTMIMRKSSDADSTNSRLSSASSKSCFSDSGSLFKIAGLDRLTTGKHDNPKRTDDKAANPGALPPPMSVDTMKKLFVTPSKSGKKRLTVTRNAIERLPVRSSVATEQSKPNAKTHSDKPKLNAKQK